MRRPVARARLRPLPGDDAVATGPIPLAERLWAKVAGPWYSTPEHPIGEDDCWFWIKRRHAAAGQASENAADRVRRRLRELERAS